MISEGVREPAKTAATIKKRWERGQGGGGYHAARVSSTDLPGPRTQVYIDMYVCMYGCMYVCMYLSLYMYIYI